MAVQIQTKPVPIIKRSFDLLCVFITLPLTLVITLVVAGVIWLVDGRPIFFSQKRPGYGGKIFTLYKFRTMRIERDSTGGLLPDQKRLTNLGRFLRSTSLDELPELLNIILGQMSLVGPRPLLVAYLERYNTTQARRHEVLPGVTGWAQTHGRNALSWEEKFALDVWYVDHWSFLLDIRILFATFWKVIRKEGINQPGQSTSTEFMGTPPSSIPPKK
jgi:sugar transferase EpsL